MKSKPFVRGCRGEFGTLSREASLIIQVACSAIAEPEEDLSAFIKANKINPETVAHAMGLIRELGLDPHEIEQRATGARFFTMARRR